MFDLSQFKSVNINEMDQVSLLNRVDTKYVISISDLGVFLASLINSHKVLIIEEEPIQNYQTYYFDTKNYASYVAHHNKKADRFKIRVREYLESQMFYLEIKHKSNKGRTIKKRMKLDGNAIINNSKAHEFIHKHSPYSYFDLNPVLGNTFKRITLVDNEFTERLTVDLELKSWPVNERKKIFQYDGLAVIELKRDGSLNSRTHKSLKDLRINPMSFSKYAMAIAELYSDEVKGNNFKKKHRSIDKLLQNK